MSQTANNIAVAIKKQSGLGSAASGASGIGFRLNASPGMNLKKAEINSNEIRYDGMTTRGRSGSASTDGSYAFDLSVGSFDDMFAALFRASAWTSTFDLTEASASLTSITTTTSTIVNGGGSWITSLIRRGDLVKLTGHSTAGNNGKWFPVVDVTASTITVPAASLTLNATPDTSFTLTVAKSLIQPSTPSESYWTVDEGLQDLDASKVFVDGKFCKLDLSAQPDQMIQGTVGMKGLSASGVTGASAPSLTAPVYSTTKGLVMADAQILLGGTAYATLSQFSMSLDMGGQAPSILAPNPPDVFLDNAKLSGSITALVPDLAFFTSFLNETAFDLLIHMREVESDPRDGMVLYIGDVTFTSNDTPKGGTGPMFQTCNWHAGKDEGGSGRAATMLRLSSTAA